MAKFAPGDIVTYYPPKKTEDDNRHWPAEVIALTANRYRVKVLAPPNRSFGWSRSGASRGRMS